MLSFTEENYLKSIVQLTIFESTEREVGVNKLASCLDVKPATVSDMVKKLNAKKLVNYKKYGKVSLTKKGRKSGMMVIRRHRLWETFLQIKLNFSWDEVHDLAEELEHIYSEKLINRLDEFLDFPSFDPHGDAIPNADGEIFIPFRKLLSEAKVGDIVKIIAVKDNTKEFLNYVDKIGIVINDKIIIESKDNFNSLTTINIKGKLHVVSPRFTDNIFIVSPKFEKAKD
ncbi:MAG: iron-dependent repressor [Crocinitomicaceae bacterium]|nr:iron-dependent repressor [Crocinitomicaceae bacterium]|tara:strand:+ start:31327 stop:32010 length:684 start_codon:yes stop_codon:yes gene_type:complete